MCANLVHPYDDSKLYLPVQNYLTGTIVSSLHRLKDIDNTGKVFILISYLFCFPRGDGTINNQSFILDESWQTVHSLFLVIWL